MDNRNGGGTVHQVNNGSICRIFLGIDRAHPAQQAQGDWKTDCFHICDGSRMVVCCVVCHRQSNLSKCAACHSVYYCSKECQVLHWKVHKPFCNLPLDGIRQFMEDDNILGRAETMTSFLYQMASTNGLFANDVFEEAIDTLRVTQYIFEECTFRW